MADFQEPQTVNDEQHLQELRERINAKAENLVKWHNTQGRKKHWEFITVWIILIAILIAVEVYSYVKNDLWEYNVWCGIFIVAAFIVDRIHTLIMQRYLTRMKNANKAPQYLREVKRLITTHKLRLCIPYPVAVLCACFVWYGPDSWPYALFMNSSLIIGAIWGAWMRNWFLDDDFCFDVDELGEMINQKSAT